MKLSPASSRIPSASVRTSMVRGIAWSSSLLLTFLTGCYHASGQQRPPLIAEEVPSLYGDRVGGIKASAAPGDYYLGSDLIQVAVDGTPFKKHPGAIAPLTGGSVLDIGDVALDQNYLRVSTPSDRLDRLTPVINQDPELPLVFSTFHVTNETNLSTIVMQGGLYDPAHKVTGATWDALDRVSGVTVTHSISLANLQGYFTLTTTLTNTGKANLGIYNLGDFLFQQGGGFRFNIPANEDYAGNRINNWGIDIPASGSGTQFGAPYESVKATMVALMGSEPSGDLDYHCSLGILPITDDQLVVTSDPQPFFSEPRPRAVSRLVCGSLPVAKAATLAPQKSLTYTRRIYVVGGKSAAYGNGYYFGQTLGEANQATGIFNLMAQDRYTLRSMGYGSVLFYVEGMAQRAGPLQTEIRIERYLGSVDPSKADNYASYLQDTDPAHWKLERTECFEAEDNFSQTSYAPGHIGALLPAGESGDEKPVYYRIAFRNRYFPDSVAPPWVYFFQTSNSYVTDLLPLTIKEGRVFAISTSSHISPEYSLVSSGGIDIGGQMVGGTLSKNLMTVIPVNARPAGVSGTSGTFVWQPMRVTVCGEGETPDPNVPRTRTLGGVFNVTLQQKDYNGANLGMNTFTAGNQAFGSYLSTAFWLPSGSYTLYGTRGPLSALSTQTAEVLADVGNPSHEFIIYQDRFPSGWTSFDVPGPSQATTGGFLPLEKFASAMAEDIQVVGHTELDRLVDADSVQADFRTEFEYYGSSDTQRIAVQKDPFVIGARSSILNGYGSATALFTPVPRNERNGGARDSSNWTLADFEAQAEGAYTIVNRPRGPQGLFTEKGISPAILTNAGSWWNSLGNFSLGHTNGQFDAIELLRGESWDPAAPDAWFGEFKSLRQDWFTILNHQSPVQFTKALGLSSAIYSADTPVGLARTYVKAQGYSVTHPEGFTQETLSTVLDVLKSGVLVASTGPFLDVTASGASGHEASIGGLVEGKNASVTLTVNLWISDWIPVEELRVVVNGVTTNLDTNQLVSVIDDWRHLQGTYTINMPAGKDAWIVVEAGVPLTTTGAYQPGSPWSRIMHGIYPIAVTNPIFVDVNGGGYTPPGN